MNAFLRKRKHLSSPKAIGRMREQPILASLERFAYSLAARDLPKKVFLKAPFNKLPNPGYQYLFNQALSELSFPCEAVGSATRETLDVRWLDLVLSTFMFQKFSKFSDDVREKRLLKFEFMTVRNINPYDSDGAAICQKAAFALKKILTTHRNRIVLSMLNDHYECYALCRRPVCMVPERKGDPLPVLISAPQKIS